MRIRDFTVQYLVFNNTICETFFPIHDPKDNNVALNLLIIILLDYLINITPLKWSPLVSLFVLN